jgi:hypothetical protein
MLDTATVLPMAAMTMAATKANTKVPAPAEA